MKLFAIALIAVLALAQMPPARAPITSNPIVDVQGKITAVKFGPGMGMPALDVDIARAKPVTVWLGSMRYLFQQNFNPKVGDSIEVKGYSVRTLNQEEEIVATQVKLPGMTQPLKLRDDNGYPVWQGGPGGPGGWCGGWCGGWGNSGSAYANHPCPHRR